MVRVIGFFAVLAAAVLGPAILSALTIRFLKGWVRSLAAPVLVIGLMAIPYVWMMPEARKITSSPDIGSFIVLGIVMLMGLILISAVIGIAAGAFLLRRHREWQSVNGRMFWMPKESR